MTQLLIPGLFQILHHHRNIGLQFESSILTSVVRSPSVAIESVEVKNSMLENTFDLAYPNNYWCHLLQLIPDHAGILVASAEKLQLSSDVGQRILKCLEGISRENKVRFYIYRDQLLINTELSLPENWVSIYSILGANLLSTLREDKSSTQWFALLTEIQMELSTLNLSIENKALNGIWVSQLPHWLFLDEELVMNALCIRGHDLWLARDEGAFRLWLGELDEILISYFRQEPGLLITDGVYCWSLPYFKKMIYRIKKGLRHVLQVR